MVMNRLIGIVALSLVAAGLSACGTGEDRPEAKAREPIPVTVVPVAAIDTAERLEAGGVVAAQESASISSRIVATIAAIRVKAGDRVRAGDVLITLDARDVTAQHGAGAGQCGRRGEGADARPNGAERGRGRTSPGRGIAEAHRDAARAEFSHRSGTRRGRGPPVGGGGAARRHSGGHRRRRCESGIGAGRGRRRHGDRVLHRPCGHRSTA